MFQQSPRRAGAHAWDFQQFRGTVAHLPAFAMKGYSEAMGFIANELNQVQYGRVMIERDRIFLLSIDVENFFALRDRGQRLVNNLQRVERGGGGVQLSEAAIDQHQARHRLLIVNPLFFLHTFVAARDHFAHRSEIVDALDGADDEFPVVRLFHLAVFPHHHRRDGLGALNVRDVETLDALGQFGQAERFLQFFLNLARVGLEHAEALVVRLLGIVARKIDQRTLVPTLRDENMHACGADTLVRLLLREQVLKSLAVLEIDGDVKIARNVRLADVKLLEQRRKKFARIEFRSHHGCDRRDVACNVSTIVDWLGLKFWYCKLW